LWVSKDLEFLFEFFKHLQGSFCSLIKFQDKFMFCFHSFTYFTFYLYIIPINSVLQSLTVRITPKLVLAFLYSFYISDCWCQKCLLQGYVFDSLSKKSLPNATISCVGPDSSHFAASATGAANGLFFFSLPSAGFYTLRITYLGYNSLVIDSVAVSGKTNLGKLYLQIDTTLLKNVTVAAKRPFIVVTPFKIILNVDESPVAAGGSAYDLIVRAPGVVEQSSNLTFRGNKLTVLLNGRRLYLSGEDLKNMLDNMQASLIERIEILPTPPSKYDADGGAIVNVVLKKARDEGTISILTLGTSLGHYWNGNSNAELYQHNKNFSWSAGYGFQLNKQATNSSTTRYLGPDALLFTETFGTKSSYVHNYRLGLDLNLTKQTTAGFLFTGIASSRYTSSLNQSHLDAVNGTDTFTRVNASGHGAVQSPVISLYLRNVDSSGREFSINADYMYYSKPSEDQFKTRFLKNDLDYLAPSFIRNNIPTTIQVFSSAADYTIPVKGGAFESGIKTTHTFTDNNMMWEIKEQNTWLIDSSRSNYFTFLETIYAGYISYKNNIKRWYYQAGLRSEYTHMVGESVTLQEKNTTNYLKLFPNLNLSFVQNQKHQLSLGYRKSIIRFGFDYINPFLIYQSPFSYIRGNPNLKPQINHQFTSSYTLTPSFIIGADYTHITKSLGASYTSNGNIAISTYDNFKAADIFYGYVNFSKFISNIWQTNINFSGGSFSYDISATSSNSVNRKMFYTTKANNLFKLKSGLLIEWNISYTSSLVTGIFKRAPYYYSDLGLSKSFFNNKLNVKWAVSDLFNTQRINMHIDYQHVVQDNFLKQESRFVNLTIRWKIGKDTIKKRTDKPSTIEDIRKRIN
jgi:hypothetical protein